MPSPDTSTIRIPVDKKEQLRKVVRRVKLSQVDVLATLIDMADQHDLLREDWQKRLNAALRAGDRELESEAYHQDPDRCPAMAKGDKKYKCVWGRHQKTPEVRILEEFYQNSKNLCMSCGITLGMRLENEGLKQKVADLEEERERIEFKLPICHKGAIVNKDASEFSGCPRHINKNENVSVAKFCKVYRTGTPCFSFAERVIGIGEK
jgi:hypothetical protein